MNIQLTNFQKYEHTYLWIQIMNTVPFQKFNCSAINVNNYSALLCEHNTNIFKLFSQDKFHQCFQFTISTDPYVQICSRAFQMMRNWVLITGVGKKKPLTWMEYYWLLRLTSGCFGSVGSVQGWVEVAHFSHTWPSLTSLSSKILKHAWKYKFTKCNTGALQNLWCSTLNIKFKKIIANSKYTTR